MVQIPNAILQVPDPEYQFLLLERICLQTGLVKSFYRREIFFLDLCDKESIYEPPGITNKIRFKIIN